MKKIVDFLKKNWYAAELTVVCFLTSVEVVPPWVSWAAIFLPALGWVIYKIAKK